MADPAEAWNRWYEAQMYQQQTMNQKKFSNEKPTVFAADTFDPRKDAKDLRKAMKGIDANSAQIINMLSKRSVDQRLQIQDKYQQIFGRILVKDLKDEMSGNFRKVVLSLMKPLSLFLAEQLKHAIKGAGTNETALIEIICTRDDASLKTIKESFEKLFDKSIEKAIYKETSGMFQRVLLSILSLSRDDSEASTTEVAEQLCAKDLDVNAIRSILTSYTFPFLKKVFRMYQARTGEDFQDLLKRKCSGSTKRAFRAIYFTSRSRPEFYAYALRNAMDGFGTDDWALIRIIVSRCEIDLGTIKEKYAAIFAKDLVDQVKSETSGDYGKILVSLLGCPI